MGNLHRRSLLTVGKRELDVLPFARNDVKFATNDQGPFTAYTVTVVLRVGYANGLRTNASDGRLHAMLLVPINTVNDCNGRWAICMR